MAPVPARRDVVLLGYAMAAATAAASKERINVSAVPLAPPISFQPLSLCLAYPANGADSVTQRDNWHHEQDRQDMSIHTKKAQRFLKVLIVLRMRVFCSLLLGYDLNNKQCLAKL